MEPSNWLMPAAVVVAAIITGLVALRVAKQKAALEIK
jgi:uncharacterized membrane-anchored protein YhcB (DUF1043 family)